MTTPNQTITLYDNTKPNNSKGPRRGCGPQGAPLWAGGGMMMFFKASLRFPIDQVDCDSDNALFYTKKPGVVAYLIAKGVDPRHVDNNGECAVLGVLR